MTQAHINSILPIKNRVLAADENTAFLAHYDLNEHDVLRGIEVVGESKAAVFDTTYLKAQGQQYVISDKITIAAWIYPTAVPTGDRGAIVIGKPSGGYYFTVDTSYRVSVYWHGKTPAGYHNSVGTCPLNQWTHIAMVWGSTELKLYINGILDSTIAATGSGMAPTAIDIGAEGGVNRHFKGKIHSLGIWAQEKSIEDIKTIMTKSMSGSESELRAFWKMNEGEGIILRDSSPLHQDIVPEPGKSFIWSSGNSVFTLRGREGYFGGGAMAIEEGTTNLVGNTDFVGWNIYGNAIITVSQEWADPFGNMNATRIQTSGGDSVLKYYKDIGKQTQDQSFTASMWVKNNSSIPLVLSNQITGLSGTITQDMGWVFKSSTGIANGVSNIQTRFHTQNVADGLDFFAFQPQIEQKAFPTSFINGTRATGKLLYPNPIHGSNEGTISFWVKFPDTRSILTSQVWFWDYDGATVTEWFGITNSGGTYTLAGFGNLDASLYQDEWHMYTIVKDMANTLRTYIDGELVQSRAGSAGIINMFKSSPNISIGSHSNGAYPANILIDELRIDKIARTDEEIMAWYQSNSPFWPRGIYRKSY